MPDGSKRRRRFSTPARLTWYARWRAVRFNRRFGLAQLGSQAIAI